MTDLIDRAVAWVQSPAYIEMTTRQLAILGVVMGEGEPMRVRELARTLKVSKPVITRAVTFLEQRGLVERQRGKDRRDRFIAVTAAGRDFRAKIADDLEPIDTAPHNEEGLTA